MRLSELVQKLPAALQLVHRGRVLEQGERGPLHLFQQEHTDWDLNMVGVVDV